jgi:hypothetical protein
MGRWPCLGRKRARALTRAQPWWHPDLRHPPSRMVKNTFLLFKPLRLWYGCSSRLVSSFKFYLTGLSTLSLVALLHPANAGIPHLIMLFEPFFLRRLWSPWVAVMHSYSSLHSSYVTYSNSVNSLFIYSAIQLKHESLKQKTVMSIWISKECFAIQRNCYYNEKGKYYKNIKFTQRNL